MKPIDYILIAVIVLKIDLTNKHEVTFHKVKGHSTDKYNNRCDELATGAIKNLNNLPF